ncbi:MAG: NTP transferase domain-containing protein [Trueperaceae bacterium]
MSTQAAAESSTPVAVVVLAAGEGKRMRSSLAKSLHEVAGRPILDHVLRAAAPLGAERTVVLVGVNGQQVTERFAGRAGVEFVTQDFSTGYGTGHALREAGKALAGFAGNIMVLNGDGPLLRPATLAALAASLDGAQGMSLVTCHFSDPTGLGRIVRGEGGRLSRIVEEKDATPEQRAITEINPGVYLFDASVFGRAANLTNDNASGEYYITDLPGLYLSAGLNVNTVLIDDETELLGVNDKSQLALAERVLRERVRRHWLAEGVTMLDPATTFIDDTVKIGRDVVLEQGVVLRGVTSVGDGARVGAHSVITDHEVAAGAQVAPLSAVAGSR